MKKTRYIMALVAAMFAVGAMLFVGCGKDEADSIKGVGELEQDNNGSSKSSSCIGWWNPKTNAFEYKNDVDEIVEKVNSYLGKETGGNMTMEFLGIEDTVPYDPIVVPMLRMSFFDVKEGLSTSVFIIIDKEFEGNGSVRYLTNGQGQVCPIVCKQGNCKLDCRTIVTAVDRNGRAVAWSCKCPDRNIFGNPVHHCEQQSIYEGSALQKSVSYTLGLEV